MKSCCFTGHRNLEGSVREQIIPVLTDKIEQLINEGVAVFINGGALGFDTLSALAVLGLKNKYPKIQLHIYVPHKGQSDRWSDDNKRIYDYILSRADRIEVISQFHHSECMKDRNQSMVDDSDFVIAYVRKTSGGSYYTAKYAETKNKKVFYI